MTTNDAILQSVIIGIPRVAQRIVELPEQHRERALSAVERTYLRTAMDLNYAEAEAQDWLSAVMDCLRAEIEERIGHETRAMDDYDGFASLESTLRLLVRDAAGN